MLTDAEIQRSHEASPSMQVMAFAEKGAWAAGERVTDLGAGNGRNSLYLADKNLYVTAIDIAPGFESNGHGNLQVLTADFTDPDAVTLPETDHTIAIYSLRFSPEELVRDVVARSLEATRPGGWTVFEDLTMTSAEDAPLIPGTWFDPDAIAEQCRCYGCSFVKVSSAPIRTIYTDESGQPLTAESSRVVVQV